MAKKKKKSPAGKGSFSQDRTHWGCLKKDKNKFWNNHQEKVAGDPDFSTENAWQAFSQAFLLDDTSKQMLQSTNVYLFHICSIKKPAMHLDQSSSEVVGSFNRRHHRPTWVAPLDPQPSRSLFCCLCDVLDDPLSLCSRLQWANSVCLTRLWHLLTTCCYWSSSQRPLPSGSIQAQRFALMFQPSGASPFWDCLKHCEETVTNASHRKG